MKNSFRWTCSKADLSAEVVLQRDQAHVAGSDVRDMKGGLEY